MARASQQTFDVPLNPEALWAGGLLFRLSAASFILHATLVALFGFITLFTEIRLLSTGSAASTATLHIVLLISAASIAAAALGLAVWGYTKAAADLAMPTPEAKEGGPWGPSIPPVAYRDGRVAVFLCFVYSGIGAFALATVNLYPPDLASAIAWSNWWMLASAVLLLAGVFGGGFLERLLALVRVHEDPFHLLRWYAGLTAAFSNWLVLGAALFAPVSVIGGAVFGIAFILCPALGIAASVKLFSIPAAFVRLASPPS